VDGLVGGGVFAGGDFECIGGGSEVEVVDFDAARAGVGAGVCVDGDEEVGLGLVGDRGACLKRDEGVVAARVDDVGAEALFEQAAETEGNVEDDVFFFDAAGAEGAGVMSAMAGVDDDAVDLEAEGTNHGVGRVLR